MPSLRRARASGWLLVAAAIVAIVPVPLARAGDLPRPERSRSEVARAARQVLRRPEFRPPSPTLRERATRVLVDAVDRVLGRIPTRGAGALGAWGALAGTVALVGVLAVRFGRGVTSDPSRAVSAGERRSRTAGEWRSEAERHEAAGEWRLAVRCRYRALLAELARRGLLEERPGRTSGEYRAEVGNTRPELLAAFSLATDLFEQAWYGGADVGAGEAERARRLADEVVAAGAT